MGLFSTLTTEATATATESSNSLRLPTVVQLYASDKPLSLLEDANSTLGFRSYEAVPVVATALSDSTATTSDDRTNKPDLGVWSCRTSQENFIPPDQSVFVWSVDLKSWSNVEQQVTKMQQGLIRYLIQQQSDADTDSAIRGDVCETSLYALKSHTFGLAPEDTLDTKAAAPDESDRSIKVSVSIVALLPDIGEEHASKQSLQVIMYHLRRFCQQISATLVFTGDDSHHPALSTNQLAYAWHQLALGKKLQPEEESPTEQASEAEESSYALSAWYSGQADDLIESVWLRKAQYPGHWDANKDSLWKIFPAEASPTKEAALSTEGDQGWLKELETSLASVSDFKSPPPKAKKLESSKTPGKDVNDFFTSLLDK